MADEARLALLILAVEDLDRAVGFYRAAFGWIQTVDDAIYAEFMLPGGQRLGLYTRAGFERNVGRVPLSSFCWVRNACLESWAMNEFMQGLARLVRVGRAPSGR